MIRKFVMGSAAVVALTTGAMAADLPSRRAPPVYVPPPVPVFSWTGVYIGGNVGYGGDKFSYPFSVGPVGGSASLTSSGIIGGGQAGFNYEFGGAGFGGAGLGLGAGGIVVGVEADYDAASINGRVNINVLGASASAGSRIKELGTARGRLGVAFGQLLVYGTGGYAYGRTTSSFQAAALGLGALGASVSKSHDGVAYGGGFEYAVTRNFTLKTEFIRAELGTKNLIATTIGGTAVRLNEKSQVNIVRAGFNYKFDLFSPVAPVVARY